MAKRAESFPEMFEERPPAREGNRLFCHEEFLEKLEHNRANTVGRRAALLLQRLLVDVRRQHYKPTQGVNRGWRRSPLGGSQGFHFYAWWAPRGAAPLKDDADFDGAPEGSVFLRDIRHHDDHHVLNAQSLSQNYIPIGLKELRQEDYVPTPWTTAQARFADGRQKIRIIKGFPGSGKTTALWHAADRAGRHSILYLTYSPELAALARDHFDKFVPSDKRFEVLTYAQLLRKLLHSDQPFESVRQTRTHFVKEVSGFSTTILGPWANEKGALYDELHAHLFGGTLPFAIGRFSGFPDRRVSARQYRDQRERAIGRVAAEAAVEVCETLRRRDSRSLEQRFFPELDLAWKAVHELRARGSEWNEFDCVAVDEVQDLTPLESLALVELAARMTSGSFTFLVAGDEAQTVRPTDFDWGWFQDLVHFRMSSPTEYKLQINLRSPRRIATLVNRIWDLYGNISKSDRPGGTGVAEIDENAGDQTIWCAARVGPELDELLNVFAEREGLAIIALGEEIPSYIPAALRDRVLTTFEAKGLDFQSVCILEGGRWLERVLLSRERGRGIELEDLHKRLAIDQLRVAVSRPSERLYWLDVSPTERVFQASQTFLSLGGERMYPVVPAVLIQSLEEDALDPEERVRLCENDARQYLEMKPALAWSRARQALALLGEPGGKFSVSDLAARSSAYLTACQVAFTLANRNVKLPQEMGRFDLYDEAIRAAVLGGNELLAIFIRAYAYYARAEGEIRKVAILRLGEQIHRSRPGLESWLLQELQPFAGKWVETLEGMMEVYPSEVAAALPALYELFLSEDEARKRIGVLHRNVIRALMGLLQFEEALRMLGALPEPDPLLVAKCHEGLADWEKAAASYLEAASPKDALRCYRSIPNFEKTLELLESVGSHPARESLHWLREMRYLASRRPAEFNKVILPEEKKLLEEVLETALGATRKKPGAKKATAKKAPAAKKKAPPKKKKPDEWF